VPESDNKCQEQGGLKLLTWCEGKKLMFIELLGDFLYNLAMKNTRNSLLLIFLMYFGLLCIEYNLKSNMCFQGLHL
jgi:hypothetical protein